MAGTRPDQPPPAASRSSGGRGHAPLIINSPLQRPNLSTRPPQNKSRGLSLADAYRMAQEEDEAAQGSPSPAPRPRRVRPEPEASKKQPATPIRPVPGANRAQGRILTPRATPRRDDMANASDKSLRFIEHKLEELERQQAGSPGSARSGVGLNPRSRLGGIGYSAGDGVMQRASSNSLESNLTPQAFKTGGERAAQNSSHWLSRRHSPRERQPAASNEGVYGSNEGRVSTAISVGPQQSPAGRPSTVLPYRPRPSPNNSYHWQAEADFTAGDLQSSNSPPVYSGRTNTKIDEIRALEEKLFAGGDDSFQERPRNMRLEEIRALEEEIVRKYPDDFDEIPSDKRPDEINAPGEDAAARLSSASTEAASGSEAHDFWKRENEDAYRANQHTIPQLSKFDQYRARELESLTRRALATARVGEFRGPHERLGSRSVSPEISEKLSQESLPAENGVSPKFSKLAGSALPRSAGLGEPISDTPVTALRSIGEGGTKHSAPVAADAPGYREAISAVSISDRFAKDRPRDLLRQLARATTSSPPTQSPQDKEEDTKEQQSRLQRPDGTKRDHRPSVGFFGVSRALSLDSLSCRASWTQAYSEADPTERIEGELQLFALSEIPSERSSVRAPSPVSDDDMAGKTPRPTRKDSLSQPTPIVTGTYVDTPATVKGDRDTGKPANETDKGLAPKVSVTHEHGENDVTGRSTTLRLAVSSWLRGRKSHPSPRKARHTLSAKGDRVGSRSLSVSAHRRTRSVPRTHSPLINSAKPPTVKDDLLEIQRLQQIEDSTLDDFAELLGSQESVEREEGVVQPTIKIEGKKSGGMLDQENPLEVYDRMSKTLQTGLLGIRTAKQGIERLEDKVAQADSKSELLTPVMEAQPRIQHGPCSLCPDCTSDTLVAHVHVPVPRLWHRKPHFKFTWLGLLLFILSLWYTTESSMCAAYCKPQYCYPGKPCDWSLDDPFWGYALPVKLDQWMTGGLGRQVFNKVRPDVVDWMADLWDAATGTDLAQVNTTYYNWQQKRRHKRRLMKKGLVQSFVERPEDRDKFAAWKSVRLAQDRVESARDLGYASEGEESMAGDEKLG